MEIDTERRRILLSRADKQLLFRTVAARIFLRLSVQQGRSGGLRGIDVAVVVDNAFFVVNKNTKISCYRSIDLLFSHYEFIMKRDPPFPPTWDE